MTATGDNRTGKVDPVAVVAPYVTNPDRDVFALRGLPEEVVAVLFAYYSRSPTDLRTALARMLEAEGEVVGAAPVPVLAGAQEKAEAFHEKWVVGYGHNSVAEHATVHLAVERCSILAAKVLEDARIGVAFTEKSTRFVVFDEAALVTDVGWPAAEAAIYEAAARDLLRAYASLVARAEAVLVEKWPGVPRQALRAHACDLCRGLLPAGVPTNVGITANARALAHRISLLRASPLDEVRRIGEAMLAEASLVVPTLLRHAEPDGSRDEAARRVRALVAGRLIPPREPRMDEGWIKLPGREVPGAYAILREITARPADRLAQAIVEEVYGARWQACSGALGQGPEPVIDAYLGARGPHDAPGRALESVGYLFEVVGDYGIWRDLARHRLLSSQPPVLGCDLGYRIPDDLEALGLGGEARAALDGVVAAWRRLSAVHPLRAQYVVPLAYRVRWMLDANLREIFHVIELRSRRGGHENYRRLAWQFADQVIDGLPAVRKHLRVDRNS